MMRKGASDLTGILLVLILLGAGYYYLYNQPGRSLVSIELTLHYVDGSSEVITLPNPNLLGQAVTNPASGKVLTSLAWVVKATPTWTGSATRFVASGSNMLFVDGTQKASYPISYTTSSGLGSLGQGTFTVYSGSVTAGTLESWNIIKGAHTLLISVGVTGILTMTDPALPTSSLSKNTDVSFAYTVAPDGLTALTITVTVTPTPT